MGMRFRKSVKICKGVKVNFSQSGASLSVGGRGHSMNYGGRGTKATVGIPGSGLSYSTNVLSYQGSNSTSYSSASATGFPNSVRLKMNSDGKMEIQDERGITITDHSLLRKIKATDSYKAMVNNLEKQRQQKLIEVFNEAKAENDKFVEIYKLSPHIDSQEQYIQVLNNLRPSVYVRKQFDIPYPAEESLREQLTQEAKESVQGSIFKVGKMRKKFVESNLPSRMSYEIARWTQLKDDYEEKEAKNEASETERYNAEFEANKVYMNKIINGEDETVRSAVESWISSCELPVEIKVNYEWRSNSHMMYLDVDLPEIEDLPENVVVRLASGNLKEKKKPQAMLKQEYVDLVFGLAIFISANVFNVSPSIHVIVISGYTQRRNKDGDVNDEYVYSIKFTRDIFENSVLQNVNPKDFCMHFENRSNLTSTMMMKKIEPYKVEE